MTQWISVVIAGLVLLVGIATQFISMAYIIGRMREHSLGQSVLIDSFKTFNQQTIDAMSKRLELGDARFTSFGAEVQQNKISVVRLETALAGHEAACVERQNRNDVAFESVYRRLDGITAQIQGIARGELAKISSLG